jgi:DNA-binding GntR family transcriptional regulator
LKSQVAAILKTMILSGDLAAGVTHRMVDIADLTGASRTPVREALMQLEERGLVTVVRGVGFRVVEPTRSELMDAYEVRLLLEVPVMGRLVGALSEAAVTEAEEMIEQMETPIENADLPEYLRLDTAFHTFLIAQHGNRRLTRMVADLREWQHVPRLAELTRSGSLGERNVEHRRILEALVAPEPSRERVEELVTTHLSLSRLGIDDDGDLDE